MWPEAVTSLQQIGAKAWADQGAYLRWAFQACQDTASHESLGVEGMLAHAIVEIWPSRSVLGQSLVSVRKQRRHCRNALGAGPLCLNARERK